MNTTGHEVDFSRINQPAQGIPTGIRLLCFFASVVLFAVVFYFFRDLLGFDIIALSIVPAAIAGWFFGVGGGISAGFMMILIDGLLLLSAGSNINSPDLWIKSLGGALFLIFTGYALGRLNALNKRVREELERQKVIEEDLIHTSSLLKAALESGGGGIVVADLKGNILSSNLQFRRIWGLSDHDNSQPRLIGRFFADQMKDGGQYITLFQQACNQPETETCQRFEFKDGRVLECCCQPHFLGNTIVGTIWRFNDVSDSVRNRVALEANEQKVRGLVDHSIDGINMADESGLVLEWNHGMEVYTGLSHNKVIGKPIWDVMYDLAPPEEREIISVEQFRENMYSTDQFGRVVERTICLSDGTRKILESQSFKIDTDKGFIRGCISRDITHRKAYEKFLIENHDLARTTLNAYPDIALLVDTNFNILSVNRSFSERVDRPLRKIIQSPLFDYFSKERGRRTLSAFSQAIQSKHPVEYEDWEPDNCLHVKVYPILKEHDVVDQIAYFARDITENRQRERELEAVASISSALKGALTPSEVYPIILDQLEILLKADGIGVILINRETDEVRVEQARGAWISLMNTRITAEQATRSPVLVLSEPYLNNDISIDSHLFQTKPFAGLVATAAVPMTIESEAIGTLWIGRRSAITKEEVRILGALGDITANAIHRARLYEQSRHNVEQLSAASEIGRSLAETLSIHEIYARLTNFVYKSMDNICSVVIARYDDEHKLLLCVYAIQDGHILDVSRLAAMPLKRPGEGRQSQVIHARQPLIVNDLDSYYSNHPTTFTIGEEKPPFSQSGLYVPLLARGDVMGVLQVQSYTNYRFGSSDVRYLQLVSSTAAIAMQNAILFENLQQSHENLTLAYEATLEGWGRALDLRDHATLGHSNRVVELTVMMGRKMGLEEEELIKLRRGAQLHDIGKMGVPDSILLKPGVLEDGEWETMRMHPLYAYQMLYPVPEFRNIIDIPYCHHEKWDGTGYPNQLKGEDIPLSARIFAIVDVWDALLSDRPYRPAWPKEQVMEYLHNQAGKHFDPQVVPVFMELVRKYKP